MRLILTTMALSALGIFSLNAQNTEALIANYDDVIPSDYTSDGNVKVIVDNPDPAAPNTSARCLSFTKGGETYKLYGLNTGNLPSKRIMRLEFDAYALTDTIEGFFIQAVPTNGDPGQDIVWKSGLSDLGSTYGWVSYSYDIDWTERTDSIKNLHIFPNHNWADTGTFLFDNIRFILVDEIISDELQSVDLNFNEVNLVLGEQFKLYHTLTPEDFPVNTVNFESLDPSVVTVTNNGVMKAVSEGSTKVVITATGGPKYDTCVVNVGPNNVPDIEQPILADFEEIQPKDVIVQGQWQIFGATLDADQIIANPVKDDINPSDSVLEIYRGEGGWNTSFGMAYHGGMALNQNVTGLELLLYGKHIEKIYVQISGIIDGVDNGFLAKAGQFVESPWPWDAPVGANAWNKVILDLDGSKFLNDTLINITMWTNPMNSSPVADTLYLDEIRILIQKSVAGVSLDITENTIIIGEDFYLTPTILPEEAENKNVSWESSDPSVATVNTLGKVEGVGAGEATITVRTQEGGFEASCLVTVNAVDLESIDIPATLIMETGTNHTFTPVFTPENASYKEVTWESDNPGVAGVDQNGTVTALTRGTANITVTSQENNSISSTCEVSVNDPVGLGQNLADRVQVYPNPTDGKSLTLSIPGEKPTSLGISMTDLSGKRVYEQRVENPGNTIEIYPGLKLGYYILQLNLNGETLRIPVIVK